MAKIKVRGMNWVTIGYVQAKKIKDMITDPAEDREQWIDVGEIFVQLKDISGIDKSDDKEYVAKNHDADNQRFYDEERKYREAFMKRSPASKAKNLEMFKALYSMTTGNQDVPQEILDQAEKIQEKFYTERTDRLLVDLHLFNGLIRGKKEGINHVDDAFLRVMEKAIIRDMYYGKRD